MFKPIFKGLDDFPASIKEMERLDNYPGHVGEKSEHQFWWDLQAGIAQLQRDAVDATRYEGSTTLIESFHRSAGRSLGLNGDAIRKAKDIFVKESAETILGYDPYEKLRDYHDQRGEILTFLTMKKDYHAWRYFHECMKLRADYDLSSENFKFLLSFGAKDTVFDFSQIIALANALNYTYVDSLKLPQLAGSYMLDPELSPDSLHPRNTFWMKYYKDVMRFAKTMAFVITPAWQESSNCWQEMGWAYFERPGKTNVIIFQDETLGNRLKGTDGNTPLSEVFPEPYNHFLKKLNEGDNLKLKNLSWNDFMEKLGVQEDKYIFATTVPEMKERIEAMAGSARGMIIQLF